MTKLSEATILLSEAIPCLSPSALLHGWRRPRFYFSFPFDLRAKIDDVKTAVNDTNYLVLTRGRNSVLGLSAFFLIRTRFSRLPPVQHFAIEKLNFAKYQSKNLGPHKKIRKNLAPHIFQEWFFWTPQNTLPAPAPHWKRSPPKKKHCITLQ